jgi:predicted DsbA family dithiol-disulfide isomerase
MHIDVYHDIPCPWCRIGKANLEAALRQWDGEPVTVSRTPFLLDPDAPVTGAPATEVLRAKYGAENVGPMIERVRQAGQRAGVSFDFERAIRAASQDAHRLLFLAPEAQKTALLAALHQAYFSDGKNIADLETLADLAASVGMVREETLAQLRGDEGEAETHAAIEDAYRLGVTGVPFFVFDGRYALSGAQPPEVILAAMRQAAIERVTAE